MSKKTGTIALIIAIASLCCSVLTLGMVLRGSRESEKTETGTVKQYVMYVGTNDKDTYQPEHTNEEARDIVDEICLKYFEGYTLQEAIGSWVDEKTMRRMSILWYATLTMLTGIQYIRLPMK
ncbi:MAG: hypothetical protein IJI04_04430 [Lachnospiraceae bacterium]|nr:hypothetical protein [Lachnospiraceae bacterium]